MMKKIAAMFLATAMSVSALMVPAYADETEAALNEVYWDDAILEQLEAQGVTGDFVTFDEIAVKVYVPDVLQQVELTDEDRDAGFIGYFQTEDESAVASVVYANVDGETLEEYKAELEAMDDVENVDMGILNGIEAVTYDLPADDSSCIAFGTQQGAILEFTFNPMSDEGFKSVAAVMMASIQPADEVETEAE